MQYRDMEALFAQLPADGRLTVHLAFQNTPPSPRSADAGAPSWTVVLRDNARVLVPGSQVRCLYSLAEGTDLARLDERATVAGLCCLDTTADPACRLRWPEVLRLLDTLSTTLFGWRVKAIVGTQEPEPRYGVTLQTETGASRPVTSGEDFDRLCLEAGPLAPRVLHHGSPVASVGARGHYPDPAIPTRPPQPVRAMVFASARQPQSCTLGGLDWLAPAGAATWVDLCAPGRDELLAVARHLCLPYRALLATLSPSAEFRCRAHWDHIALRLPVARRDPLSGQIQADALDLIVGPHVVVSVHASRLPALIRARRRLNQESDQGQTTVPVLFGAILGEVLGSEEALARWLVRECAMGAGRAEQVSDLRQAKQAATELWRLVEWRYEVLADADRLARHLQGLALIPWWGDVTRRRESLLDALRRAEETAEDGLRLAASAVHGRGRHRMEHTHLWIASAVLLLAGLIPLVALHPPPPALAWAAMAGLSLALTGAILLTVMARERLRERERRGKR